MGIALAIAWWAVPARADDVDDLLHRGVELRRERRDAEALSAFEQAYAARPSARAMAQIGLAHQALGHWLSAERTLGAALAEERDPWIAENRAPLAAALETIERHLGWLEVTTNMVGSELWVDGALVGRLPSASPVRLVNGSAVVELRSEGHRAIRRTVEIAPGGRTHEDMPMAESSAPASLPPRFAIGVAAPPPDTSGKPSSTQRAWGFRAIAAGAVLTAGGVVAHVLREREAAVYNDDSKCFYGTESRNERCGDHRRAAETETAFAIAGYVSGGVIAAAGALLVASAPDAPSSTRIGCRMRMLGASCAISF
jgi:hypothetical protein